ncbi:pyridoxal-phosphate dependent enzyme [Actinomadura atramentaria]|uniref:pyridoxal-phosphate dependent enzyme n=1 Tax=Actinomadura atramentaria TaxID=1990 RepID=UPI00037A4E7C|nr:pyridoxal-phosphate dependent enzyme [Actinomadura atramentaria]
MPDTEPAPPARWAAAALRLLDADRDTTPPTPLRPVPTGHDGVRILLKDESALPGGTLKHRAARAMLRHAIASGRITENTPLVEATGGGAAHAQAALAKRLGLPYTAVLPGEPDPARAAPLHDLGADCRFVTPPLAIYDAARRLAAETGGCFLDQFAAAEPAIDRAGDDLAAELFDQAPDASWVVAGIGTGATAASLGRRIRTRGLAARLAVADPENSAYFPAWTLGAPDYATGMPSRIEGIGRPRVEPGFLPGLYDLVVPVPDAASAAAARAARAATGLPVGGSTGTCLWAALHLAARLLREDGGTGGGTVVAVLGDAHPRHLKTVHDDAWCAAKGLDPAPFAAAIDRFTGGGPWEPPGGQRAP